MDGLPWDAGEDDEEGDDEPDGVVGENLFDHHTEPGNRKSLPSDEVDAAQGHVLGHAVGVTLHGDWEQDLLIKVKG